MKFLAFLIPAWRWSVAGLVVVAGGWLSASAADAPKKIGVLLKGDTEFWSAMEAGCRDAAREEGYSVIVRRPSSESDIAGQIALLKEFEPEGISALVIAPCSSTELSAPVAAFAARGVKIVVVDSPLDLDMPAYIATNHTNAGEAAGKILGGLIGDHDEVSIFRHTRSGGATLLRESSSYAAISALHPGIVIHRDIFGGMVPGEEANQAKLLLTRYPHTQAVLASGTVETIGMLQTLEDTGRAGQIKFVGFGFNLNPIIQNAIEVGTLSAWIAQLPTEIGHKGVAAAIALIKGQTVPEVTYCDFMVITKANLHTPEVEALLGSAVQ